MRFKDSVQRELHYRSQIDYCYYAIREIDKEHNKPKSPLVAAVDRATGYGKEKDKIHTSTVIGLMKTVVRCKTALGIDCDGDKEALKAALKLQRILKK